MSNTENTQLTPAKGYDTKRVIFSEPISGVIPNQKGPKIEFKRINIFTRNEDGTTGELILPTEKLFSFGVSENTNPESGKVNGYTFPLCLWNRDGATKAEKEWTDTFSRIVDRCIDHLIENREEIDMFELTRSDLTKSKGGLDPLYWKREKYTDKKGKTSIRRVPGFGPTLYTKLIYSKKSNKFLSQFFDRSDKPLNALDLMGKYCHADAAIKIESIFIGSRISLQVKLYEAVVEPASTGMKRLLTKSKPSSKILQFDSKVSSTPMASHSDEEGEEEEDDVGSIDNSESDNETEEEKQPSPKKTKKKIVRKVRKVIRRGKGM